MKLIIVDDKGKQEVVVDDLEVYDLTKPAHVDDIAVNIGWALARMEER